MNPIPGPFLAKISFPIQVSKVIRKVIPKIRKDRGETVRKVPHLFLAGKLESNPENWESNPKIKKVIQNIRNKSGKLEK